MDSTPNILAWYDARKPRFVDLVGDYAGKELFLVEGDSLLRHCFEDDRLDFHDGFQLLHAVFVVEQLLENLIKRHCNFHIAFFDDNRILCIPPGVDEAHRSKYLLARTIIIRHLLLHLPSTVPDVHVNTFPSLSSSECQEYFDSKPIHFVMSHDGALPTTGRPMPEGDWDKKAKSISRSIICHFNGYGLNVALLNRVEFRDSKVFTMVFESGIDNVRPSQFSDAVNEDRAALEILISNRDNGNHVEVKELLDKIKLNSSVCSSEKSQLNLCTIASILSQGNEETLLASAFVLHTLILEHIPLSQRRLPAITFGSDTESKIQAFLNQYASTAADILHNKLWVETMRDGNVASDLVDSIDGRLFRSVINAITTGTLVNGMPKDLNSAWEEVKLTIADLSGHILSLDGRSANADGVSGEAAKASAEEIAVMPFSNPIFDKHLDRINVNTEATLPSRMAALKIYRETSHWHNHRKPLNPKQQPEVKVSKWHNPLRTNQRYQAEMQTYAASLTGAKGKALEPETITVGSKRLAPVAVADEKPAKSTKQDTSASKKGAKKAPVLSKKDQIIQDNKEKKGGAEAAKANEGWSGVMKNLDELTSDQDRFLRAKAYLDGLDQTRLVHVGLDISIYIVSALFTRWSKYCKLDRKSDGLHVVALLWSTIRSIVTSQVSLSKDAVLHLEKVCTAIGISDALDGISKPVLDKRLSFTFKYPAITQSLDIGMPQREFQLRECGPYMDRYLDAKPDPRVASFTPDGWQRKVLDELDSNNSVFVVAPTSAGKTFISFYAMEKVLRENNDDVLVYVAPTKALVNQIAAEVQGRFSKKYPQAGKSVWAIHTRDYRVNNSTGCQILVTVPHVLQIMLMAPTNAKSWAPRVKRIIFDEIHSIGNAEDGVVWEQLLLLAPCPIIALSATIGNPEQFSEWLAETQKSSGTKLTMIQHSTRYSDLRKYLYDPPSTFAFTGLGTPKGVGLGLDGLPGLTFFHPVASLIDKTRGMPDDLGLEPRDCFLLWQAMDTAQNAAYPISKTLDPTKALPFVIKKADVFKWEKELKQVLSGWMHDRSSPFDQIVTILSPSGPALQPRKLAGSSHDEDFSRDDSEGFDDDGGEPDKVDKNDLRSTTLPLLYQLHQRHALPAILFNYDRTGCEEIAESLLVQLKSAEEEYKEGKEWKRKIDGFTKWQEAEAKKRNKKPPKASKKSKGEDGDEGPSKADTARDQASMETSPYDLFDPEAPQDAYSFADRRKAQPSEIERYVRQLRWKKVPEFLIDLLQRGIGVHHAGMNRKYRQCVEMLFRKQFLRVVIATGTLSLGINMPCATVVFSGDSVFLTALNFRQAAGRSGRRGFDLLGNVVFQGITRTRASRLLSSRLPDLTGHFPITTSLVLRLFTLLYDSKGSPYATRAINSLLSQPRLYLGGESFKEQVLHHLRFSIEYLRRQNLLGPQGQPVNWTSCVSHLYFTENSAFAFHALLKGGYFSTLCSDIDAKGDQVMREMMLTLSHIFGRQVVRETDDEDAAERIRRSPSVVYLEPLPKAASIILRKHNQETLSIFQTYVKTFAKQHCKAEEKTLPLTGMEVGQKLQEHTSSNGDMETMDFIPSLEAPSSRSTFVALSGHGDDFETIEDLCSSTRAGVFLESAVVPHLQLHPEESRTPLNAYLLDFFMHGSVVPLEEANGIRKSDVWFALNDFSLVLATIVTSLANYLGLGKAGEDGEMLDMGGGDEKENEADEEEAATASVFSTATTLVNQPIGAPPIPPPSFKKLKRNVAEDWDDAEDAQAAQDKVDDDFMEVNQKDEDEEYDELFKVYRAFSKLKKEFDSKFREIFA